MLPRAAPNLLHTSRIQADKSSLWPNNSNSICTGAFPGDPAMKLYAVVSRELRAAVGAEKRHLEVSHDMSRDAAVFEIALVRTAKPLAPDRVLRLPLYTVVDAKMGAYFPYTSFNPSSAGAALCVPLALIYNNFSIRVPRGFIPCLLVDVDDLVIVKSRVDELWAPAERTECVPNGWARLREVHSRRRNCLTSSSHCCVFLDSELIIITKIAGAFVLLGDGLVEGPCLPLNYDWMSVSRGVVRIAVRDAILEGGTGGRGHASV